MENLVPVPFYHPPPLFFFIIEDSGKKKFTIINFGLQGVKSCYENGRSLQNVALTVAFL